MRTGTAKMPGRSGGQDLSRAQIEARLALFDDNVMCQ